MREILSTPHTYLDSAATTPLHPLAAEALQHYGVTHFGNAASTHKIGQAAQQAIHRSRQILSQNFKLLDPNRQLIFTSGGSEANHLALWGSLSRHLKSQKPILTHCSSIEHPSVIQNCSHLATLFPQVTHSLIPVTHEGIVTEEALMNSLTPQSTFVSIQAVNNITGVIQDVESLAQAAKKINPQLIFHCDAVQALGKIKLPQMNSTVDLLTLSAHKIGGPKGAGALVILNPKIELNAVIHGGEQESGMRSGTSNTGAIVGFSLAFEEALREQEFHLSHFKKLKNQLLNSLKKDAELNHTPLHIHSIESNTASFSPHIFCFSVPGVLSAPMIRLLDERGFSISTGSACHSKSPAPESVILAQGKPISHATSVFRVSFLPNTTTDEVTQFSTAFFNSLQRMKLLHPTRPPR